MTNIQSIPTAAPTDIVEWSRSCGIKVDGHSFNPDRIPQLIEPMRAMTDSKIRNGTLVKPVQTGGSTVGEVILCFWLAFCQGLLQMNWQDDLRAEERWSKRLLDLLRSVKDLCWAGGRYNEKICEAKFINSRLIVQGIKAAGALDSETVPMQINEEIHLWAPGTLAKARRRQTLVWNSKALDISNAGITGDQLESAWESGSMEIWKSFCPGCGKFHRMQFRWDDKRHDLGGLRFDPKAGYNASRKYSLAAVVPTIRYQMPCGFIVHDTPKERRALDAGTYEKTNPGALDYKRSWNYDAVSVSEIKWPELVGEYLTAIKAHKSGDGAPLIKFIQERECRFYDAENDVPFRGQIVINNTAVQNRIGLKGRAMRAWFADKQRGFAHKLEMTHYWLVIRDIMPNADSMLIFEGMVQTDADLIARLQEHDCLPQSGAIDCTWDRANVLQLCYRNNFNAQTTSAQDRLFFHKDEKAYRIYSEVGPLCKQIASGFPTKFPIGHRVENGILEDMLHPEEPRHWSIHRIGMIKLLFFLRNNRSVSEQNKVTDFIKWEVPGDISEDYKKQIESWEFTQKKSPTSNAVVEVCRQRFGADHLLMCEAGIANLMLMSGILPARLASLGVTEAGISHPTQSK